MKRDCPHCAQPVPPKTARCPHCGEPLERSATRRSVLLAMAMAGLLGLCLCAVAVPNVIEARKIGGEAAPIGALKTINTSQTLFREGDKDGDGVLDYGTLAELEQTGLIDSGLGSGTKQGYLFVVQPSPTEPEYRWAAVANPVALGETGDRAFATDQSGSVYYRLNGTIELTPDGTLPPGLPTVGR